MLKKILWVCGLGLTASVQAMPSEIILMRHLHKALGDNPPLSQCGVAQATALRSELMPHQITKAWHTSFNRTLETAQRLVDTSTVLQRYDAKQPATEIKKKLEQEQGLQLVVGHSNTIPALLASFGVEAEAIGESDYGTLYRLRWEAEHWVLYRAPFEQRLAPCQSAALQ